MGKEPRQLVTVKGFLDGVWSSDLILKSIRCWNTSNSSSSIFFRYAVYTIWSHNIQPSIRHRQPSVNASSHPSSIQDILLRISLQRQSPQLIRGWFLIPTGAFSQSRRSTFFTCANPWTEINKITAGHFCSWRVGIATISIAGTRCTKHDSSDRVNDRLKTLTGLVFHTETRSAANTLVCYLQTWTHRNGHPCSSCRH